MANNKTAHFLIADTQTALPKRGGKYVSQQQKTNQKIADLQQRTSNIKYTPRQSSSYEPDYHDGPFHWGEGSC